MHVVQLGFATMKGTRHVPRELLALDEHGPVGDRIFCVVDVARRQVLRTVQHPSLLAVLVRWDGRDLDLELPDGTATSGAPDLTGERITCDYWGRPVTLELTTGPHSELLAAYLGKPAQLAMVTGLQESARVDIVYGAPVSVVSTASLRDLAARSGRNDVLATAARFRMTMVVETGEVPYAEDQWLGRELGVGDAVVRLERPVSRCGIIDLDPVSGAKDGSLLKALAGYRPTTGGAPWLGVDATVVVPGDVRRGAACDLRGRRAL